MLNESNSLQIDMKKFKVYLGVAIGIMLLLTSIPIIFYTGNFHNFNLSKVPNEWGTFGDYIGGILNPIIGLCNIAVLIFISYYVAKWENDRHKNEFLYRAYINLSNKLDSLKLESAKSDDAKELHSFISTFTFNQQFLFEGETNTIFQQRMGSLAATVSELKIELEIEEKRARESLKVELEETFAEKLVEALKGTFVDTGSKSAYSKFDLDKQLVLGFIQRILNNGDYTTYRQAAIDSLKKAISALQD